MWDEPDTRPSDLPSFAVYERGDTEQTRLSALARAAFVEAVERDDLEAHAVQLVKLPSGQTIVVEVRGQSSWTGHGRQGMRPGRAAFLRDCGYPVLLVFVEGAVSYRWCWLSELDGGPAGRLGFDRSGWDVSLMRKVEGPLRLPACIDAVEPAQGQLV